MRITSIILIAVFVSIPAFAFECIGEVMPSPPGLSEVVNNALLVLALGDTGKGKLCMGKVFEATKSITVFRVWNALKNHTRFGSWWSFAPPQESIDEFREKNAICPEWSELNAVSKCSLKLGAQVVVGPGQSAECKDGVSFAQSATNQVFIPNNVRNKRIFVENCAEAVAL